MPKLGYPQSEPLRRMLLCGAGLAALCLPQLALAQDDPQPVDDDAAGNAIIVTATKRAQTLQDVPVAVSVTTAETIERAQIRDLRDLQTVVPSLQVGQRQSVANTNFFIRGFGNGANNAGIEPSVGVFVDNVYRSRTVAQVTDLPDVQRIEVLRGPQSTLFGKNASAGVISITTQSPQFTFGGSAELTYGNYDQVIAKGHVTGPISDMMAASFAAGINKRDGFFRDLGTGDATNERDRFFLRGQLLAELENGVTARFIADYDAIDENCCAVVNVQNGIAGPAILALGGRMTDPADPFSGVVYNNFNSTNDIENFGVSAQFDIPAGDFDLTSVTAYRSTDAVTYQDSDFTSADLIYPNYQDLNIGSFTQELRLVGELYDGVDLLLGAFFIKENVEQANQLKYATQFRPYASLLVSSLSGGALTLPMLEAVFGQADGRNYTGRFLASGQGFDEAYELESQAVSLFGQVDFEITPGLILTAGGNYTKDKKRYVTDAVSSDVFSSINFDAPQYAAFRGQLLVAGGLQQAGVNPTDTAAVTAFATNPATANIYQGILAFAATNANNPLANPLAPLRALQYMPPFLNVPNFVEDGRVNDSDFSYTLRLAYDVSDAVNVYASYATGFKASSINLSRDSRPALADRAAIVAAGLSLPNLIYTTRFAGPENTRVIEFGLKANLGWLSANVAVFDQHIEGFQSNIFTGSGFALRNAGKQSTVGAEFDGQARFDNGLTLNLAVTYLDPTYDSFLESAVGDITGTKPAGIPEWTVVIGAQYEADLGSGVLIPRVSYLWATDTQLIEGLPNFLVRGPDGTIIDATPALAAAAPFSRDLDDLTASLSYEFENGLSLTAWGRNLLNSRDLGVIFDSPAQPRGISGYPNDPRTYGGTVRFRW